MDGNGVHLSAPLTTPDSELRAIIQKRANWIVRHASEPSLQHPPKQFVSGETLPYLGRNVRLIVKSSDEARFPKVHFDHWSFRLTVPKNLDSNERYDRLRRTIVTWYREHASKRLADSVGHWHRRLGIAKETRMLIRDQHRRWGSCAPDGTLRLNWRIVMLEPALIEYVVVHELVHLIHRNHSPDFWRVVFNAMPDAQRRRRRLREVGRTLPL